MVHIKKCGVDIKIQLRKTNLLFPPQTWNVFEITLNNDNRTNNVCEAQNNRFTHLIGYSHPTIWVLIKKIKLEVEVDRAKIVLSDLGETYKKDNMNKKNIKLIRHTLCQSLQKLNISIEE